MNKGLFRVAVITASALLSAALPAGTASAATSNDCPESRSTHIFTSGANGEDRVWIDSPTPSRTVVCFKARSLYNSDLTIIIDGAESLPDWHVNDDPFVCPGLGLGVTDPIPVWIAIGNQNWAVCVSLGGTTTSIELVPRDVSGTLPTVEIWRDGGADWGLIDAAACPVEYVNATQFGGPTTCMESNERLVP